MWVWWFWYIQDIWYQKHSATAIRQRYCTHWRLLPGLIKRSTYFNQIGELFSIQIGLHIFRVINEKNAASDDTDKNSLSIPGAGATNDAEQEFCRTLQYGNKTQVIWNLCFFYCARLIFPHCSFIHWIDLSRFTSRIFHRLLHSRSEIFLWAKASLERKVRVIGW